MMYKWILNKEQQKSAHENMQIDFECLQNIKPDSSPAFRFYDWEKPAATYGYFTNPWDFLDAHGVEQLGLDLARRPTGGGIIFHMCDIAFSVLVSRCHPFYSDNTLEIYQTINQKVLEACENCVGINLQLLVDDSCKNQCEGGFCMTQATIYDVVVKGRKVGGAAVRKTKAGLLYQGSLCLGLPSKAFLASALKEGSNIQKAMYAVSFPLNLNRYSLKKELIKAITS